LETYAGKELIDWHSAALDASTRIDAGYKEIKVLQSAGISQLTQSLCAEETFIY
jgi:hypothetical protein